MCLGVKRVCGFRVIGRFCWGWWGEFGIGWGSGGGVFVFFLGVEKEVLWGG